MLRLNLKKLKSGMGIIDMMVHKRCAIVYQVANKLLT